MTTPTMLEDTVQPIGRHVANDPVLYSFAPVWWSVITQWSLLRVHNNCPCVGFALGDWFWLELLWSPAHLHLHPVTVLPSTRSHFWRPLWRCNWHVEPRMHSVRTADWSTAVCRWGRSRSDCLHHWDIWYTSHESHWCWEEIIELYCSEWLSTVCGLMHFGTRSGTCYVSQSV